MLGTRRLVCGAVQDPLYVVQIDAPRNRVVVGAKDDLLGRKMTVIRPNWIAVDELREPRRLSIRIRSRAEEAEGVVSSYADGRVCVQFDEPQRAITPGQAAVFYDDDVVVGGGWISL